MACQFALAIYVCVTFLYYGRARKDLEDHLTVVENWDLFCTELDKKKVKKNIYIFSAL